MALYKAIVLRLKLFSCKLHWFVPESQNFKWNIVTDQIGQGGVRITE